VRAYYKAPEVFEKNGWFDTGDIAFVEEIPHTATGKIQKMALRQQFKDYRLPTAQAAE